MENYTLSKPIEYDGEMITEILMDLDELTVRKIEQAEREAQKLLSKGEVMALPEYNKKYLACVAAKAAGVKAGLIFALGAKDYTQITMLVRGFLLGGDSDEEEEEETEEDADTAPTISPKKKAPAQPVPVSMN